MNRLARPIAAALVVGLVLGLLPAEVWAQPQPAAPPQTKAAEPSTEASTHYRRGVGFYEEKNYSAALAEFRRAYELLPNFRVLYNIGQMEDLLHSDAKALQVFEKYLADGGKDVPDDRRREVEGALARLRQRVARVEISSDTKGTELVVDDVSVGVLPISEPLTVDAGRHQVVLRRDGRTIAQRTIDVASGDVAKVTIDEPKQGVPEQPAVQTTAAPAPVASVAAAPAKPAGRGPWPIVAWSTAGALAVGTTIAGTMALSASNDLQQLRKTDGATRAALDAAQSTTTTRALVADILGAATIVTAGVAAYLTFWPQKTGSVALSVGPASAAVSGSF